MKKTPLNKGFTIYFAVLVGSLALAVGVAIFDLVSRELTLSQFATQSQYAIYAADTGIECALYWDSKAPVLRGVPSVFGTSSTGAWASTASPCAGVNINTLWGSTPPPGATGSSATTTFSLTLPATAVGTPCVIIDVGKFLGGSPVGPRTLIQARGYNTCTASAPLRVERALEVNY